MKRFLKAAREKIGDFWWYSIVLFCVSRSGDALNAFIGLWLVPKYVDPAELGAVLPLMNFANFLAVPIGVFAYTFRNEVMRLSVVKEYGRLKSLLRGVFAASGLFLVVALVASRVILPHFLERIRIVEGSLGIVILATAFVGAVAPVFFYPLQALKKFRAASLINALNAPIRLVTMLVFMPLRALSGYFVGQASTPAFNIVASVFCLRRELAVPAAPYWTRAVVRRFARLLAIFAASAVAGGVCCLVESTVLRQRLPDLDSAGYYMATRFSEIAGFLTATLSFTLFPFAAELAAKGKSARGLIFKSTAAIVVFSALVALPFFFIGEPLLSLLPHGERYAAYWWAIPWLIGIGCLTSFAGLYSTAEISANRFGYLKWMIPLDLAYPALLLVVTGWGYFTACAPDAVNAFFAAHNVRTLGTMLVWMTVANLIKAALCLASLLRPRGGAEPH